MTDIKNNLDNEKNETALKEFEEIGYFVESYNSSDKTLNNLKDLYDLLKRKESANE